MVQPRGKENRPGYLPVVACLEAVGGNHKWCQGPAPWRTGAGNGSGAFGPLLNGGQQENLFGVPLF